MGEFEYRHRISLRPLQEKDAGLMFEWLSDQDNIQYLQLARRSFSLEDAQKYIRKSWTDTMNKHYAIVDEQDEYMGTASLKNLDEHNKNAEYAITLRRKAMGRGIAGQALKQVLPIAFLDLSLHKVYSNVLSGNKKSISMLIKAGFIQEGTFVEHVHLHGKFENLEWYRLLREEWFNSERDHQDGGEN